MIRKVLHTGFILVMIQCACMSQSQEPPLFKVTKMPFNDAGFSEISPVIVKDGIIFCSDRRFSAVKDRTSFAGHRLYNLYIAERKDTSEWKKPVEIRSERSNLFNSGPLCFAPDGKTVYFTSEVETGNITKKRKFKNHLGIFIAELDGTNLVSIRPFLYNNPQYDVGQPSISSDGRYLFFASTMPGGQGNSDIYYCEWINGNWGAPVNPGPGINSPGVENFPFMHRSGRLYFSSDKPGGLGRLDVYYTTLRMGVWEAPEHMPEPINSPSDDFAFTTDDNLESGYFASNRQRDDNIYHFSSTIIRKASCDTLIENNYCYQMVEENAVKYDSLPFRYDWKFGDGEKGVGASVIHCYAGPGSYLVQLDVTNLITREVIYNEKSYNLVITNVEQPYITGPETGKQGESIKLDADETNLPGWNITRYYWNFDDGSVGIGKEVDKIFQKPGTYNIQLIVTSDPLPGGVAREACVCKNIIITP